MNRYPNEEELYKIKAWRRENTFALIDYLRDLWTYNNYFKEKWVKDILHLELHTGGWSGNESIINSLKDNKFFFLFFHEKWERGGHFYFEINPRKLGYMPVSEFAKQKGISRQAIHKKIDEFDQIKTGVKKLMIREKL